MKRPRYQPQFRRASGDRGRRLENLLLANRQMHWLIANAGKAALTCMIWPRFVAPFRWRLTRYSMPLAQLDPAFKGYRILQLSDLHVGRTRLAYLEEVFLRTCAERPDLIVLTGDLIDYSPEGLPLLRRLLKILDDAHPPGGVVAIFGNHDYHEYSWRHNGPRSAKRTIHRRLVQLLHESGIRLLRNELYRVRRGRGELMLVGLDEMWTGRADAAAAFRGIEPGDPVICLQHNPDGVEGLKEYPWQFMLCGHSHGGQANFPLLGPLFVPMQHRHYLRGFFHFRPLEGQAIERRTMFVSTGLGYSHPLRLRCPPEATIFTLEPLQTPAPGAARV